MGYAYVSLGSNFPEAARVLKRAKTGVNLLGCCRVSAASSIYLTEPQNLKEQPWFSNQVLKLEIWPGLAPEELLRRLLDLETWLGRTRNGPRFGPRLIDIDLLFFAGIEQNDPDCILPHPRLLERAFCLAPLLEIEPELRIKGKGALSWLGQLPWRLEGNKIFQ